MEQNCDMSEVCDYHLRVCSLLRLKSANLAMKRCAGHYNTGVCVCMCVCEWKEKHKQKTKICENEYKVSTAVLQLLSGLRHKWRSIGRDNGGIGLHHSPGFKRCCNCVVHKWEKIQTFVLSSCFLKSLNIYTAHSFHRGKRNSSNKTLNAPNYHLVHAHNVALTTKSELVVVTAPSWCVLKCKKLMMWRETLCGKFSRMFPRCLTGWCVSGMADIPKAKWWHRYTNL